MYVHIIYIFIFGDKEQHSALFILRKVQQNSFDTALLLTCMTFFLKNVLHSHILMSKLCPKHTHGGFNWKWLNETGKIKSITWIQHQSAEQYPKPLGTDDVDSLDCEKPLIKSYLGYDKRNQYIYILGMLYEEPENERNKSTSSLQRVAYVLQNTLLQDVLKAFGFQQPELLR